MSTKHEPMTVTIEGNDRYPELEQSWSDLDKLRWLAGLLAAEGTVDSQIYTSPDVDGFMVAAPGVGFSNRPFDRAWSLMSDFAAGARYVQRVNA